MSSISDSLFPAAEPSVLQRVRALRRQLDGLTTIGDPAERQIRSGCQPLDQLLPGGSFMAGSLIEWLAEGRGGGSMSLAMWVARQALRQRPGSLVVTDRWQRFYPPAAVAWGIDPARLIVVRSAPTKMTAREELWALDQALRCAGVCVVMAWIDPLDSRAFRRLQLAAETGRTVGFLLRPARARGRPSWSDAQLLVEPRPQTGPQSSRHCRVTLLHQRGRAGTHSLAGTSVDLEIDELQGTVTVWKSARQRDTENQAPCGKELSRRHESSSLHMASRLARSTTRRRSAGA